jgi:hypothetical protein
LCSISWSFVPGDQFRLANILVSCGRGGLPRAMPTVDAGYVARDAAYRGYDSVAICKILEPRDLTA